MVQAVAVVASLRPAGLVSTVRAMMGDRDRPESIGVLVAAAALVVIVALPAIKSKREEAFQEEI